MGPRKKGKTAKAPEPPRATPTPVSDSDAGTSEAESAHQEETPVPPPVHQRHPLEPRVIVTSAPLPVKVGAIAGGGRAPGLSKKSSKSASTATESKKSRTVSTGAKKTASPGKSVSRQAQQEDRDSARSSTASPGKRKGHTEPRTSSPKPTEIATAEPKTPKRSRTAASDKEASQYTQAPPTTPKRSSDVTREKTRTPAKAKEIPVQETRTRTPDKSKQVTQKMKSPDRKKPVTPHKAGTPYKSKTPQKSKPSTPRTPRGGSRRQPDPSTPRGAVAPSPQSTPGTASKDVPLKKRPVVKAPSSISSTEGDSQKRPVQVSQELFSQEIRAASEELEDSDGAGWRDVEKLPTMAKSTSRKPSTGKGVGDKGKGKKRQASPDDPELTVIEEEESDSDIRRLVHQATFDEDDNDDDDDQQEGDDEGDVVPPSDQDSDADDDDATQQDSTQRKGTRLVYSPRSKAGRQSRRGRGKASTYTEDQEEAMLDFIRDNPMIWDKGHKLHKDKVHHKDLCKGLDDDLGLEAGSTHNWYQAMRNQYLRAVKKQASGAGTRQLTEREQWIKDKFDFIRDSIQHRPGKELSQMAKARPSKLPPLQHSRLPRLDSPEPAAQRDTPDVDLSQLSVEEAVDMDIAASQPIITGIPKKHRTKAKKLEASVTGSMDDITAQFKTGVSAFVQMAQDAKKGKGAAAGGGCLICEDDLTDRDEKAWRSTITMLYTQGLLLPNNVRQSFVQDTTMRMLQAQDEARQEAKRKQQQQMQQMQQQQQAQQPQQQTYNDPTPTFTDLQPYRPVHHRMTPPPGMSQGFNMPTFTQIDRRLYPQQQGYSSPSKWQAQGQGQQGQQQGQQQGPSATYTPSASYSMQSVSQTVSSQFQHGQDPNDFSMDPSLTAGPMAPQVTYQMPSQSQDFSQATMQSPRGKKQHHRK